MSDKLVIIGYSGHSYVIIETAILLQINIMGYCDKNIAMNNPFSLPYLGNESDENFSIEDNWKFIVSIGDNKIRKRIIEKIGRKYFISHIIHPSAQISKSCEIGIGVFINANACINALAKVGDHSIINTGSIIEHECLIGDFVHIGPGTVLAGNVVIGSGTFVGANSVIKQGIKIGENVIIGAGSVVINDIPDNVTVVGNPSRKIR